MSLVIQFPFEDVAMEIATLSKMEKALKLHYKKIVTLFCKNEGTSVVTAVWDAEAKAPGDPGVSLQLLSLHYQFVALLNTGTRMITATYPLLSPTLLKDFSQRTKTKFAFI